MHNLNGTKATLDQAIDVCKLVSLGLLIWAGGEILEGIKESGGVHGTSAFRPIINANRVVLFLSYVIGAILFAKIIFSNGLIFSGGVSFSAAGQDYFRPLLEKAKYLSMAPVFLYALMNLYIAVRLNTNTTQPSQAFAWEQQMKAKSLYFFIFSNLSVCIPLILVLALTNVSFAMNALQADKNLFLSGAVAVVILVSAISSKAVEEYYS